MKKLFLLPVVFFFLNFDCSQTPVIIDSICEITSEICEYSQAICEIVGEDENIKSSNLQLERNLFLIRSALNTNLNHLSDNKLNFSNDDLNSLKFELTKIRDKMRLQYIELMQRKP